MKVARYATKVAATLAGNLKKIEMPKCSRAAKVAWFSFPGSPGQPARKPPHTWLGLGLGLGLGLTLTLTLNLTHTCGSSWKKAEKKPRRISTWWGGARCARARVGGQGKGSGRGARARALGFKALG